MFVHHDWDIVEHNVSSLDITSSSASNTDNIHRPIIEEEPGLVIPPIMEEDECPYCLCRPCVTDDSNRQLWWEIAPKPSSKKNNKLRKPVYKRFWTMLFHRRAFLDVRYSARKAQALGLNPRRKKYQWLHRRDLLPNCVLDIVRQWYPNPLNMPYMGHKWD